MIERWGSYSALFISTTVSVVYLFQLQNNTDIASLNYILLLTIPFVVSLIVLAGTYWIHSSSWTRPYQPRILGWYLAGFNVLAFIGFFLSLSVVAETEQYELPMYLILNSATTGAGLGIVVAAYDIKGERRDKALRNVHDMTQFLLDADSKETAGQIAVDTSQAVIDLPLTGFWLVEDDKLKNVAMSNAASRLFEDQPDFTKGDSIAWDVFEQQEPRHCKPVRENKNKHNFNTSIKSEYIVPVGEHGVLISGSLTKRNFSSLQYELTRLIAAHTELVLDRIERTNELEARKRDLKKQNKRLGRFTSVVAHDLRNPINIIDGYLTRARETHDEKYFDEVQYGIDRMNDLVEDLLALTQSGIIIQDKEPLEIGSIATKAAAGADLDGFSLELDDDLDTVYADESRLLQLFENLFRNSVEHAESGDTISVERLTDGFAIEDDGQGIPEEKWNQIFDYGYTVSESGTGLGLAIVNEIVQGHGWRIDVKDGRPSGARFEITVPEGDRVDGSKTEVDVA